LYRLLKGDPMASISGQLSGSAVEFFFLWQCGFFCVFKFYLPGKTKKIFLFLLYSKCNDCNNYNKIIKKNRVRVSV
jgi:hypothetical protein